MMTRQQLVVLVVMAFIYLYVETRERVALIYFVSFLNLFGLLVHFAGHGNHGLTRHIFLCSFDVEAVIEGIIKTKLPIMFSPFLLLLVCFPKQTGRYMKRYWWVSIFAMITMIQPLFCFNIHGVFDTQRLAMVGVWPFFLLAGLLLRDTLKSRWALWVYIVLPFLYGTDRLNLLKHTYPSIVGHRTVMNGIVLFIVLMDMYYLKRKYGKISGQDT